MAPGDYGGLKRLKELGIDPIYIWFFPPDFVHPKLLNPDHYVPESRGGMLLGMAVFTTTIVTFVLILRIISRSYVLRQFSGADAAIIFAWVCMVGSAATSIWGYAKGCMGHHVYDCNTIQVIELFKYQYAISLVQPAALTCTRAANLFFLWEITPITELGVRRAIIGLHFANLGVFLFTWCPIIFQCAPATYKMWDLMEMVLCIDKDRYLIVKLYAASTGLCAALDIAMLLLPIRLVWKLNVPVRTRMVVSSVFLVGLLACAASVVRTALIVSQFGDLRSVDLSWKLVPTVCAGLWEQTFGMITACAPSIKAAYSALRQKSHLSRTGRTSSYVSSGSRPSRTRGPARLSSTGLGFGKGLGLTSSSAKHSSRSLRSKIEPKHGGSTQNLNPWATTEGAYGWGGPGSSGGLSADGVGEGGPDDMELQLQDLSGYLREQGDSEGQKNSSNRQDVNTANSTLEVPSQDHLEYYGHVG